MDTTNRFEQIERFLDGSMSGEELDNFKQKLSNDTALQEEVEFQRSMESVLAHKPEDDLRQHLETLDKKYNKPPSTGNNLWLLGLLFFTIAGLGTWYFSSSDKPIPPPPTQEVPLESNTKSQDQNENEERIKTPDSTTKEQEQKAPKEKTTTPSQTPQKKKTTPKKKRPIPMAANFEPIEILESRLSNLRSGSFEVNSSKENYQLKNGLIDFEIEGLFKPSDNWEAQQIKLYLFNNKMADYEDFKPVFSKTLALKKTEDNYQLNLIESIPLNPGLYYIQIEDESGEVIYLDKLKAK